MAKTILILASLTLLLGFKRVPAAGADAFNAVITHPGPRYMIRLDPQVRERYIPPPVEFLADAEYAATANIVVNFNGGGWTTEAQDAFEFAAGIWETLISSPITIEVDATFQALGEDILGGAGPAVIVRNFPGAPQAGIWYPIASANKLAGSDLEPGIVDIQALFSSNFPDWYFGTNSSTPSGQVSFASVVLHELGHGLGFLGSMEAGGTCGNPAWGCYGRGADDLPMIYDLFVENGAGTPLLTFDNYSSALAIQLTSGDLYFNSPGGNFANGGNRVPIYAPSTWQQGSSYSHLAQSFNGTNNALMTFSISRGETIHHPGSVTLCMFAEMGWTVAETCSATVDTPISGLTASNNGPSLFGGTTQLSADISSGSNVSYAWDFGDGTNGSGKSVSHQYTAPGTFNAQVTATNSVSQQSSVTNVQVEVAISGLRADNDGPTLLGMPTLFTATISSGTNVSYAWDFGDGQSGSGAAVAHQYASPGTYSVELTAGNAVSQEKDTTVVFVAQQLTKIYLPLQVHSP